MSYWKIKKIKILGGQSVVLRIRRTCIYLFGNKTCQNLNRNEYNIHLFVRCEDVYGKHWLHQWNGPYTKLWMLLISKNSSWQFRNWLLISENKFFHLFTDRMCATTHFVFATTTSLHVSPSGRTATSFIALIQLRETTIIIHIFVANKDKEIH